MNPFIHQTSLRSKIPNFYRKFITFRALIEDPKDENHKLISASSDPFQILAQRSKSKGFTLKDAKILHCNLFKTPSLQSNVFIANCLIDWYFRSYAILDATQLFDEIPDPNIVSLNIMISGCNQNRFFEDSWRYFCRMRKMRFDPNQHTYGGVLSACSGLGSILYGELVYVMSIKDGFFSDGYVRSGMIDLYAKCGGFEDALRVFCDCNFDENVVCWSSVISGAVKSGENSVALELFNEMHHESLNPNVFGFASALSACVVLENDDFGKVIHGLVIKHGVGHDVFIGTAIVDLYAKCGDIDDAVKKFVRMPVLNVVAWTAMISGFVQNHEFVSAIQLFKELRKLRYEVNNYTITSILTACGKSEMFDETMQIHSWILKSGFYTDLTVMGSLINAYSKVGALDFCIKLFSEKEETEDVSLWALMISAFAHSHSPYRAVELFWRMLRKGLRPDKFSTSSVLSVIDSLDLGRQVHSYVLKTGLELDVSVGSSLLTMYSKVGSLKESYKVFDKVPDKDNVSWASMISGFSEHGFAGKAMDLFRNMLSEEYRPDQMALVGVLTACSDTGTVLKGKEVHSYALRAGIGRESLIGGALVNMYSKCGALDVARRVFHMIPVKDQVSYCALVSGYAQSGHVEEALELFSRMLITCIEVDSYTMSSVIGAVGLSDRSESGSQLHPLVFKLGLHKDASVGSSLITMYSKCGSVDDCRKSFDQILRPDLIAWTTMIMSYAQHGKGAEALRLFELMTEERVKPDSVTFVAVLTACSHSGLVEEGYFYLNSMSRDYGIEPNYRHYACMVDLLGRAGRLKEAETFSNNIPIKPNALIWGTLLAACKVHGDNELGKIAAQRVIDLEPSNAGAFVSLSNMLADVGHWEEVLDIRSLMKGTGVNKEPGWSHVGDTSSISDS